MAAAYWTARPTWDDSGSVLLTLVATTRRVQLDAQIAKLGEDINARWLDDMRSPVREGGS